MGIDYPKKRFEHIYNSSDRVKNIIKNGRELSKESFVHKKDLIHLTEVQNFLDEQKSYYKSNHPEVSFDFKISNLSTVAHCHKTEFFQVLTNIIKNGVEVLTENKIENPSINILIESSFKNIIIKIIDNGPGIPKDVLKNMGSTFNTSRTSGLGLGLSITHNIIKLNNGRIDINSSNEGTTFNIEFERHRHAELVLNSVDSLENIKILNIPSGFVAKTNKGIVHLIQLENMVINYQVAEEIISLMEPFLEGESFHLIIQRNSRVTLPAMKLTRQSPIINQVLSSATISYNFTSRIVHKIARKLVEGKLPVASFNSFEKAHEWTLKQVSDKEQENQKEKIKKFA
jgi:hypothetical protein